MILPRSPRSRRASTNRVFVRLLACLWLAAVTATMTAGLPSVAFAEEARRGATASDEASKAETLSLIHISEPTRQVLVSRMPSYA